MSPDPIDLEDGPVSVQASLNEALQLVSERVVDLPDQTAALPLTTLASSPEPGVYEVSAIAICTTPDPAAGDVSVTVWWTDDAGKASELAITALPLTTIGRKYGRVGLKVSDGDINYSTSISTSAAASMHAVYVRLKRLA